MNGTKLGALLLTGNIRPDHKIMKLCQQAFNAGLPLLLTKHDTWQTILRAHAITNGCCIAAINRVGIEGNLEYWGRSFVADQAGSILAEGAETENSIVYADVSLEKINIQRSKLPFFNPRKVDTYEKITERVTGKETTH